MLLTTYSLVTALIWFSLFALLFVFLRRKNWFVRSFRLSVLLFWLAACLFRAFFPVEFRRTKVLRSWKVMPFLRDLLQRELFQLGDFAVRVGGVLLAVWALGAAVLLLHLIVQYRHLYRMIRHAPPVNDPQLERLLLQVWEKEKPICLRSFPASSVPLAAGFLHPVILWPETPIPPDYWRDILRHELQHHREGHIWMLLIANLCRCLLWWNPLVWLLRRDLEQTLELKCDLAVVSTMAETEKAQYFESILYLLQAGRKGSRAIHAPGLVRPKYDRDLVQRFELGLLGNGAYARWNSAALCCGMLALLLLSYCFVLQPASMPNLYPPGEPEMFILTKENAYLVPLENGAYALYADGNYLYDVLDIAQEPLNALPIIVEELD